MKLRRSTYPDKITRAFAHVSIVILLGARQVGKTSLMENYGAEIDKRGKKKLFLNGQDPEIAALFQKRSVIEHYLMTYLGADMNGFLFLDEFQFIPGISTMLKVLSDKYRNLKVLCSGSSSLDIIQQVEESLAGRVRVIEVLPLSFMEYLVFNDQKLADLHRSFTLETESSALTAPVDIVLNEYLLYGGFPRAALVKTPEDKIDILNDIYQTYLLKDIRNYISQGNIVGYNRMLRMLSAQIGNLLNVNEVSRESGLPRTICEEYLHILEQMGIIKLIDPYFVNKRKVIGKMKKIYFVDLGLRNLIEKNFNPIEFRGDRGALFENYVMLELWRNRRTGGELQFFRTSDGTEVDFVLTRLGQKAAVECKYKTLEKPVSLAGFNHFCEDEGITDRYIVNRALNTKYRDTKFLQGILVPFV